MTQHFRRDGTCAPVTGADSGIGPAVAEGFAGAGGPVFGPARSAPQMEETAEVIRIAGGKARALPLDVTDTAACHAALDARPVFLKSGFALMVGGGWTAA
ncbi:SDR family NAD(P)-dependent oxidoreductase [Pseudooceanicola sp.]|uniref:SDR family NAD(P)-dependent oxidoreductase n=1 Tax=Pseudooceanicola sp. TaxID=1914328 RepID=UPI003510E513